jgi:DNA-binding transcriptional LysR family regulator
MEAGLDLNLVLALDALLEERSVSGAAKRLHTSSPAMSRTLAKLRRILGDPVLVRAGSAMVPTPHALAMQGEARDLVERVGQLFTPPQPPDPLTLRRTFSVRIGDPLFSAIGPRLLSRIRAQAPAVTLRFVGESTEDTHALRDGSVDLELGQIRRTQPEMHIESLMVDQIVGVARSGHDLTSTPVTVRRFAAAEHVVYSRRGRLSGPIDDLLAEHGLTRNVVACAPTPIAALFLITNSDLVGILPGQIGNQAIRALGIATFHIPLALPTLEVSMAWHPRFDADGAHRWLRQHAADTIRAVTTN